jgi:hypothetical protein
MSDVTITAARFVPRGEGATLIVEMTDGALVRLRTLREMSPLEYAQGKIGTLAAEADVTAL